MGTPLTMEGLLAVLGLAAAAVAVLLACVLLSLELRSVAPVWVPWALAALSFGLGVSLARALALIQRSHPRPGRDQQLSERIAVEAELAVMRLAREQRARVDV